MRVDSEESERAGFPEITKCNEYGMAMRHNPAECSVLCNAETRKKCFDATINNTVKSITQSDAPLVEKPKRGRKKKV